MYFSCAGSLCSTFYFHFLSFILLFSVSALFLPCIPSCIHNDSLFHFPLPLSLTSALTFFSLFISSFFLHFFLSYCLPFFSMPSLLPVSFTSLSVLIPCYNLHKKEVQSASLKHSYLRAASKPLFFSCSWFCMS